jgi:hypothetical protein
MSLAQVEKQRAFLLWPNELLLLATTTPVLLLRTIIVRLLLLQSTSLDLPKRRRQRHKFRNKFIQHFLHLRLSQKFTLPTQNKLRCSQMHTLDLLPLLHALLPLSTVPPYSMSRKRCLGNGSFVKTAA